jgi:hypothetical protein
VAEVRPQACPKSGPLRRAALHRQKKKPAAR